MDQRAAPDVNRIPAPSAARVTGHFGELVQGRFGHDGPVALVTLRCPALGSTAEFHPGDGSLVADGTVTGKVLKAARAVLGRCAPAGAGGRLRVVHDAPPGGGAGTSTSDTLAAIRAIAAARGAWFSPEEEVLLCQAAEGAVDPLMYPPEVLFASREGRMISSLPPVPPLAVVGGFAGPGEPTQAEDDAFPDMEPAFRALSSALDAGDHDGIARAARMSAEANQERNPNAAWDAVRDIGRETGALGPVVSHTGSAIGLLYTPGTVHAEKVADALVEAGLTQVLHFHTGTP